MHPKAGLNTFFILDVYSDFSSENKKKMSEKTEFLALYLSVKLTPTHSMLLLAFIGIYECKMQR